MSLALTPSPSPSPSPYDTAVIRRAHPRVRVFLPPWHDLIRDGVPAMKVTGRELKLGDRTYAPGELIEHSAFSSLDRKGNLVPNRIRLRQMYEQRRIEPAEEIQPRHRASTRMLAHVVPGIGIPEAVKARPSAKTKARQAPVNVIPDVSVDVAEIGDEAAGEAGREAAGEAKTKMKGYVPSKKRK